MLDGSQLAETCAWVQFYDQIYQENFERARKEEQERAREAVIREQGASWGAPPQGGPPGLQNSGWGANNPAGNGWQGMASVELNSEPPSRELMSRRPWGFESQTCKDPSRHGRGIAVATP